jgi:prepilin-type N-terminal cleavage/methylation domain-containing protein
MQTNKHRGVQQGSSRHREGFTLLEILLAVVIAAIAASALFVGFDSGFGLLRTTREDLRATQILMQRTEAVRLLTWTNAPGPFQEYYYSNSIGTNVGPLYIGTFDTQGDPTNIPNDGTVSYRANLHLVTITLKWTNYTGPTAVPHSRVMQTLSAQNGIQSYVYGSGN